MEDKLKSALDHVATLLKRDGWTQSRTVREWLNESYARPGEFKASEGALDVLGILGHEDQFVSVS